MGRRGDARVPLTGTGNGNLPMRRGLRILLRDLAVAAALVLALAMAAPALAQQITTPLGLVPEPDQEIEVSGFRRFRVVNDLKIQFGPKFALMGVLMYQNLDNNMPQNNIMKWYTGGIRPVYYFSRYFSLVGEFGMDYTSQEGLDSGSLMKISLAPQITPFNRLLTRPALRAYFTYAHWSDDFIGKVAPVIYPDQNQGISFGLQMEVWW